MHNKDNHQRGDECINSGCFNKRTGNNQAVYESAEFNTPEDYKPKSHAEEEAEFARKMLTNPDPVIAKITIQDPIEADSSLDVPESKPVKIKKTDSIIITSNKKEVAKPVKAKKMIIVDEIPKKKTSRGKYAHIHEKWEDYLLDYTDLSHEELMDKYGLPDVATVYRLGKECKEIAVENGMDIKEFRRKPVPAAK